MTQPLSGLLAHDEHDDLYILDIAKYFYDACYEILFFQQRKPQALGSHLKVTWLHPTQKCLYGGMSHLKAKNLD